jgi:hypothetical protein
MTLPYPTRRRQAGGERLRYHIWNDKLCFYPSLRERLKRGPIEIPFKEIKDRIEKVEKARSLVKSHW